MRKSTAIALSAYMVESREGWPPSFEDVHTDRLERLGHLVTALGLDAVGYDRLVVLARRVIASRTFPVLQRAIADAAIAKNRLESDDLHELVKHLNPTGETTPMTDKTDDGDRVWKEWANRHLVESTASTAARCPATAAGATARRRLPGSGAHVASTTPSAPVSLFGTTTLTTRADRVTRCKDTDACAPRGHGHGNRVSTAQASGADRDRELRMLMIPGLPRQPGGFEGLIPCRVGVSLNEQPVADRPDLDHVDLHLLLAALRHRVLRRHDDDSIARVDELLYLDPQALELPPQIFVVFPDSFLAAIYPGLWRVDIGVELDVGVDVRAGGSEIAPIHSRIDPAHEFHVRLRHHLLR
jgi:hypothetical protein